MAAKSYLKTTLTICAVLFLLARLTFAAPPRYEIIDLGTLGGDESWASFINDLGQIAGSAYDKQGNRRATLFDSTGNGNNIDLGTLGGKTSGVCSINNNGQIVGFAENQQGYERATLFDPTGNGDNIDLGTLGEIRSNALAINDSGQIVGSARNEQGYQRATLFDSSGSGDNIDLGTLGGIHSQAWSINDRWQIVGNARITRGYSHATLFDPTGGGNNIDLGTLGGNSSNVHAINNRGQIVGWAANPWQDNRATLFDPTGGGKNIELGTLGGSMSWAHSINDLGQIAGAADDQQREARATLFDPTGNGKNIDLNTIVNPGSGWVLTNAFCINNHGWIVGNRFNQEGQGRAFLMKPFPRIIYVDDDAGGANDGSSWIDAYNHLQDALTAAWSGDEIRVAQGTYKPDQGAGITPGDREATFQLIDGVIIKGGYAGTGYPDPNARDVAKYETILSGDLDGNDVEPNDPYDLLIEPSRAENSYHVVTASQVDETDILTGFTVSAGNANGSWDSRTNVGGGMLVYNANLMVNDCIFRSNSAQSGGGGMSNEGSSLTLTRCRFIGNSARDDRPYYSGSGGGFCDLDWECFTKMFNCVFANNSADSGGGIFTAGSRYRIGVATVSGCEFYANSANLGGGVCGGIADLRDCTFTSNLVGSGGGIFMGSDTVITNCIFSGNIAWGTAGAQAEDCDVVLTNCTFVGNLAYGIGGIWNDEGRTIVTNCILWGNMSYWGMDEPAQIATADPAVINYSCIQGWTGLLGGTGNIGTDPCFAEMGYWEPNGIPDYNDNDEYWFERRIFINGDYHLLPDSPCIDAGDPNYIAEPNETDLDGSPRVISGRIDMGAYEYSPPIPADIMIIPRTINLRSKGRWIVAFIWLPEEYDIADIEPNSILLENEIEPERFWLSEDRQIAIANFSREDVQPILEVGDIELTITGRLTDGTPFEAADTIKVIERGGKK